jgi:hypothetical protein
MAGHAEIIRGWVGTNTEGFVTSAYRKDVIVFVDIPARDIYHLIWSLMNAFTVNHGDVYPSRD